MVRDLRVSEGFQVSKAFELGVEGMSTMHYRMRPKVCVPSARCRDCLLSPWIL